MIDRAVVQSEDSIIIRMDPGGPVELRGLTDSFAALARLYERHYRPHGADDSAPRLYVTRLESGSVIAEIVPYAVMLGTVIAVMDSGIIVSDFTRRLCAGIQSFADPLRARDQPKYEPSKEDATDIQAFVRPLTGKRNASLGIKHARFEQHDGEKHTVAEYKFDETELNRASVNIDQALLEDSRPAMELLPPPEEQQGAFRKEVMLFFEQASRRPGKEKGRTGDRGIVPDITSKPLPVYFRKSIQDLKERMVRGEVNPLTDTAYIVDLLVQRVHGEPKAYVVTHVYEAIQLGGGDEK